MKLFVGMLLTVVLATSQQVSAAEPQCNADEIFSKHKVEGTFVVEALNSGARCVHNEERVQQRFLPASTFKIPNSIIALETGAVRSTEIVIPWDGRKHQIEAWNKSHNLRTAIKVSSVPTYQELAHRAGLVKMKEHLTLFEYGNQQIGEDVKNFWLRGPLQISAAEQIEFLKKLYARSLPVSKRNQDATIDILEYDRGSDWVLRAKTGWAVAPNPDIGWFVGWLEAKDETYVFALNMDISQRADLEKRISVSREILTGFSGVAVD